MPRKDFSVKQEGIDYFFLIVRHIDRMSDSLTAGLGVGEIGTKPLVAYIQMVFHLESLLINFLDAQFYEEREKIIKKMPEVAATWSEIEDQISYFLGVQELFQLLIVFAYKEGVLKLKLRKEESLDKTETESETKTITIKGKKLSVPFVSKPFFKIKPELKK